MIKIFKSFQLNYKILFNHVNELYSVLFFLLLIMSLFPICLGPDLYVLSRLGLGLLWIILILIILNTNKDFLKKEFSSHQFLIYEMKKNSIFFFIVGKWLSFWLFFIFPSILIAPFFLFFFGIPLSIVQFFNFFVILFISTLSISYISLFGSIMTLYLTKNDFLISFFLVPFYLPVLIFSINASHNIIWENEDSFSFHFILLLLIFYFFFGSFLIQKMIKRISL